MQIRIFKDTETMRYAAEELAKYLGMMDSTIDTEIVVSGEVSDVIEDVSGKRSSDLLERYRGKAFTANSISVNSVLPHAKHIRVSEA